MTATITDLKKWREEHPDSLRLLSMMLHCTNASIRLYSAWWAAMISSVVRLNSDENR